MYSNQQIKANPSFWVSYLQLIFFAPAKTSNSLLKSVPLGASYAGTSWHIQGGTWTGYGSRSYDSRNHGLSGHRQFLKGLFIHVQVCRGHIDSDVVWFYLQSETALITDISCLLVWELSPRLVLNCPLVPLAVYPLWFPFDMPRHCSSWSNAKTEAKWGWFHDSR